MKFLHDIPNSQKKNTSWLLNHGENWRNVKGATLLEYRRQHNIFEPDDYIIHDGELKVFAMWSSAVEGCAYIGYAYAENGEMAHKDEFRHATDEEIKAGKRLEVK